MLDKDILLIIPICFPNPKNADYVKKELRRVGGIFKKRDESFSPRLQSAIIKCADGNIKKFDSSVNLAIIDWRDTLMKSGFGFDINKHNVWIKEKLNLIK